MAAASMAAPEPGTPAAPNPGPNSGSPNPASLFRGVGVALVTLFDSGGEVDAISTGKLAAGLAGRGLAAVLVNGTTGEAGTLTGAERTALIEAVRAAVPDPVVVIAGTGAPSV
jgi:dihydrodipicolinate synthase/N-acetylneuraminate lyase